MSELRRQLIAQAMQPSSPLPKGYVECEYLESSGKQWIDTGIVASAEYDPTFEIDFNTFGLAGVRNAGMAIFGANTIYNNGISYSYDTGAKNCRFSRGSLVTISRSIPQDRIKLEVTDNTYNITGAIEKSETYTKGSDGYIDSNIYLFALNRNGAIQTVTMPIRAVVWSFILRYDNKDILNFIPALDPDGRPCMYDTISKQPFYNNGTGEFGYKRLDTGEVVAPK